MSNETPRPLAAIMDELLASWKTAPWETCERCGERWKGAKVPLCRDCEDKDAARVQASIRAKASLAAIDRRWHSVTYDQYRCPPGDAEALSRMRGWGTDAERGLFLWGQPGGGKSHLAFALMRELLADGVRVFASDWTDLLRRLRRTYDGPGEHESDILAEIDRADVVILDDLAAGRVTDWAMDQLWAIVQMRYGSMRPLIATCNLSLRELARKLSSADGDRIVSRLAEMCERVEVRARDYRLHGGGDQ